MGIQLFDLSTTDCLWLCWCRPVTGVSRALRSIANRWPPTGEEEVARASAEFDTAAGRALFGVTALSRERRGGRSRYVLRMRVRVHRAGDREQRETARPSDVKSRELAAFVDAVLPDAKRREARPLRFCGEFAYSLARRRPVFELPVEFVGPQDRERKLRGARLHGLEFSFQGADAPLDGLRVRVDAKRERVYVRVEGTDGLSLGDDPVRAVHDCAEKLALVFTEEVASA